MLALGILSIRRVTHGIVLDSALRIIVVLAFEAAEKAKEVAHGYCKSAGRASSFNCSSLTRF